MKTKAYSIIELMVVIAIVGLLTAITLPVYRNYRIRASINQAVNVIPFYKEKILDYFHKNGSMPNAQDLGLGTGATVDSSYYSAAGPYVNYIEISSRNNGSSLCASNTKCTDLIIGWNTSLGIGSANTMWIRFWEEDSIVKVHCGLWSIVPAQYRSLYPPNCQGVAAAFSDFSV